MSKVLVLYYSMYGHVETLAGAVAAGVQQAGGATVDVMRVPETIPNDVARQAGVKLEQPAPVAKPEDLLGYDAYLFGTPTRFGNMAGQMRNFLDQIGPYWLKGEFVGKVGSVFTSTGTGGGNETTITSFWHTLAHLGMVIVGLPYEATELLDLSEVKGGSPYGAATIAGSDGSRQPNDLELAMARFQGRHVAAIANRLHGS